MIILFSACTRQSQVKLIGSQMTPTTQNIISLNSTPNVPTVSSPTIVISEPKPTLTQAALPVESKISSPLAENTLDDLSRMISNPFHPPMVGSDDPHQGVDFSIVDEETKMALPGRDVYAMVGGEVIGIMQDRFPYGNAILIKTADTSLPENWRVYMESLEIPGSWNKVTSLTCPEGWNDAPEFQDNLSLFILYAHLKDPIYEKLGQKLFSGDKLGVVGMSGNALAPHLHLEIRYGFNEDFFGSMAHYDVSASLDEMANYCRWRVSGWYRIIDPMILISMD